MKKIMMMALVALLPLASFAGDGTKENPYTVAELNAQKDALATSGDIVWVKADLKGLGVDGTLTENTEKNQMAGLFGDATDTFVAYSYQILQGLAISDLTNTKDLLISLTYGTTTHPHGNNTNPQYATDHEKDVVTGDHFSLAEVHGALSLTITNGFRGYHFVSCYIIPKELVGVRVSGNVSGGNASVNYGYYDGAEEGKTYVMDKDKALVLLGYDGTYDLVLSANYYEHITSNDLYPGTQAGVNQGTTKDRWRLRYINDGTSNGFQRNSDENCTVILQSKDEIYFQVSSQSGKFVEKWTWESPEKNWISWAGMSIADFDTHTTGIQQMKAETIEDDAVYNLQGQRVNEPAQKGIYIKNGKKYIAK